jgi:hypothetical protein
MLSACAGHEASTWNGSTPAPPFVVWIDLNRPRAEEEAAINASSLFAPWMMVVSAIIGFVWFKRQGWL